MRNTQEINTLVESFIEKHDIETESQFLVLIEEVGELAETLVDLRGDKVQGKGKTIEDMREELADCLYILVTLCVLEGWDWESELYYTARENSLK